MKRLLLVILFVANSITYNCFSQASYYINSNSGQPWGTNVNQLAMNNVFGAGGWTQAYFQTVNVPAMLSPTVCFIFMEGSDSNANALNTFLSANMVAIQNWVSAGGKLFLNAGPNQGANINFGFGGTTLNYNGGTSLSPSGNASPGQTGHPIFNGPCLPCGTAFTGNWFSHAYITGGSSTAVITATPGSCLSELSYGSGRVMFGGMITTNWHLPQPNAIYLRQNIFVYLYCGPLSVSQTQALKENISVYPNPSEGNFTIEYNSQETLLVQVFNETGQLVHEQKTGNTEDKNKIDLSSFPKGLYLLKIKQSEKILTKRIIIQ